MKTIIRVLDSQQTKLIVIISCMIAGITLIISPEIATHFMIRGFASVWIFQAVILILEVPWVRKKAGYDAGYDVVKPFRIVPHPDQEGFPGRISVQEMQPDGEWKYRSCIIVSNPKVEFEPMVIANSDDVEALLNALNKAAGE